MPQPKRIQRSRASGWRTPANTVYVGRPTKWGNPWVVWPDGGTPESYWCTHRSGERLGPFKSKREAVAASVEKYRRHARGFDKNALAALRGKDLACWCPPGQPCHADVLLELANG
jgi:hypothetical protein